MTESYGRYTAPHTKTTPPPRPSRSFPRRRSCTIPAASARTVPALADSPRLHTALLIASPHADYPPPRLALRTVPLPADLPARPPPTALAHSPLPTPGRLANATLLGPRRLFVPPPASASRCTSIRADYPSQVSSPPLRSARLAPCRLATPYPLQPCRPTGPGPCLPARTMPTSRPSPRQDYPALIDGPFHLSAPQPDPG